MMNFKRLLSSSLLLPVLSTAAGCDLIQEPDPTPLEGGGCVEEVTVLAGIDEVSSLGFSAAQVLDVAVGAHMSAMEWGEGLADGGVTVKFGPESGAAQLAVTVEYAGGEVRYVKSTPEEGGWDGGYADCSDRLEVDASVSVKSSGGALDESFVAALRASTPRIATLKQVIEHEALGGSLALTTVAPAEASVGAVNVDLGFTEDGLFGGAWSQVEVVMGEVVGATWMSYARWPGFDSPCESFEAPLALNSAAAGFSGADMLALVASAGPLEIQWQGAPSSSLALTLVHDGAAVCASHEGEGAGALRLGAIASVMTGDGRWMGSFPVQVSGEPGAQGELLRVNFGRYAPYGSYVPASEFEATFGLQGVDLSGFDAGSIGFDGVAEPIEGGATVSGALVVLGVNEHSCPADANGCEGNEYKELEDAIWGSI